MSFIRDSNNNILLFPMCISITYFNIFVFKWYHLFFQKVTDTTFVVLKYEFVHITDLLQYVYILLFCSLCILMTYFILSLRLSGSRVQFWCVSTTHFNYTHLNYTFWLQKFVACFTIIIYQCDILIVQNPRNQMC